MMDVNNKLSTQERIRVDEVEVYVTATMEKFQDDFRGRIDTAISEQRNTVVVVVFSPQSCDAMLRSLGCVDEEDSLTELARRRWEEADDDGNQQQSGTQRGHTEKRKNGLGNMDQYSHRLNTLSFISPETHTSTQDTHCVSWKSPSCRYPGFQIDNRLRRIMCSGFNRKRPNG